MKHSWVKWLKEYGKYRLGVIILLAAWVAIFWVLFYLRDIPYDVIGYGTALCTFMLLLIAAADFSCFRKKCINLYRAQEEILHKTDRLPIPTNATEKEYDGMIRQLFSERLKENTRRMWAEEEAADYFALWAHQIKTPIAAMSLLLQTEQTEHGEELEAELFRIACYADMALTYLRVDGAASDFVFRSMPMEAFVKPVVKKYAKMFIRKKIALEMEGLDREVLTDGKWMGFVVEQLISNALKYTTEGTISIIGQGDTLLIRDTGIGIAQEDLPRIFEKGFTGYNGRTDKKSTGIGLYLCKRILDKLGYSIEAKSIVGAGTEMCIAMGRPPLEIE